MNKTNKVLIGSVSALCIVGTIVLLKAVFTGAEFGSVSDWVNSICNVAMASSAIYAAYKAKQWFSQLSYTTAFNKAAEVLVDIDNVFGVKLDLYLEINQLHYNLQSILDGSTIPAKEMINDLVKREKYLDSKISELTKIKNDYSVLKRWPIKIHNSELVEQLLNNLILNKSRGIQCIVLAESVIEDSLRQEEGDLTILFHDFRIALEQFNESYYDADYLYEEFNNKSFSDYFS